MKSLAILALGAAALVVSAPAQAGGDSGRGGKGGGMHHMGGGHSGGGKMGGHHFSGGHNYHGGFNWNNRPRNIQRFNRGWYMPSYWIAPSFYVGNWGNYGFAQPSNGYNWVRHYDDAYMVDGRGRVYDSVYGVDWDRYDDGRVPSYAAPTAGYQGGYDSGNYGGGSYGYDDAPRARSGDRDNGLGGALIGGVVGGIAGNRIAGKGDRTAGTLLGAGVGAIAGAVIDKSEDRNRRDRGYGYPQGSYPQGGYPQGGYEGGYGTSYDYPGDDRVTWNAPQPAPMPTPAPRSCCGGYVQQGAAPMLTYAYPGPMLTTITIQSAPVTTTTTTTYVTEEVVYAAPKKTWRPKRKWKPKPRCTCR
jgi:Ni/Co efflux regulator RcnB